MALTKIGKEGITGISNSSDATAITIDSSENVGIGTSSPSTTLTVVDDVSIEGSTPTLSLADTDVSNNKVELSYDEFLTIDLDPNNARGNSGLIVKGDGNERMRIDSIGNLGLNTGSSTGRATGKGMEILHVGSDTDATLRLTGENGSSAETFSEITHVGASRLLNFKHHGATRIQIDANGSVLVDGGSVGTVSDSRVKKDIEDLSDGLSIVKQLRPVKFKYKGNTEYYNGDDKTYHGFIADEVKAIAPQYITEVTNKIYDDEYDGSNIVDFDEELKDKKFTSVDDFKTMSQTDLIPMLVKAIQELEARITALENAE
jgi:hypothetical protein